MQPQVRDVSFQAQTLHPSLYYPRFHGGKNLFIICFQAAKPSCKFLKVVLNKFSRLCFKDLSLDIGCCCTHFLPCPFTDVVVQCVLGRMFGKKISLRAPWNTIWKGLPTASFLTAIPSTKACLDRKNAQCNSVSHGLASPDSKLELYWSNVGTSWHRME